MATMPSHFALLLLGVILLGRYFYSPSEAVTLMSHNITQAICSAKLFTQILVGYNLCCLTVLSSHGMAKDGSLAFPGIE